MQAMFSGPTPSPSETNSSRVSARSAKPSTAKADAALDLKGTGLVYVSDDTPGLTRIKSGSGFRYRDTSGKPVKDPGEISRINKLAIPPAYTRVWICPRPNGHLQATGYDARGRKQYRYHTDWQALRGDSKFERLQAFGKALPRIRARVARDLAPQRNKPVSRSLVLATLVRLLDTTFVRVGNDEYARDNGSYGLTTLRNKHVDVKGSKIFFEFRGKSGVEHRLSVTDRRLANIIKRCMELPGQNLFQYLDDDGQRHTVSSHDINQYLHTLTGADFTAKDYRTWAGSAMALATLRKLHWEPEADAKKHVVSMVKEVARLLGNTPAVCRKCYIHPAVLEAFAMGELAKLPRIRQRKGLRLEEVALAGFLQGLQAAEVIREASEELTGETA